jgi:hypothetical protein
MAAWTTKNTLGAQSWGYPYMSDLWVGGLSRAGRICHTAQTQRAWPLGNIVASIKHITSTTQAEGETKQNTAQLVCCPAYTKHSGNVTSPSPSAWPRAKDSTHLVNGLRRCLSLLISPLLQVPVGSYGQHLSSLLIASMCPPCPALAIIGTAASDSAKK